MMGLLPNKNICYFDSLHNNNLSFDVFNILFMLRMKIMRICYIRTYLDPSIHRKNI